MKNIYCMYANKMPIGKRRTKLNRNLFPKHLEAVRDGRKLLLTGLTSRGAEHQLSIQLPRSREVPLLLDALVNERAVVLQVGAEAFALQGGPDCSIVSIEFFSLLIGVIEVSSVGRMDTYPGTATWRSTPAQRGRTCPRKWRTSP